MGTPPPLSLKLSPRGKLSISRGKGLSPDREGDLAQSLDSPRGEMHGLAAPQSAAPPPTPSPFLPPTSTSSPTPPRSDSPKDIPYPYPLYRAHQETKTQVPLKPNQVSTVTLYGVRIVSLTMDGKERLCLAQISNTLLKEYSYNEIHNRRVALGITCVQCTPVQVREKLNSVEINFQRGQLQLEILRRAGAMPISSRRCGMITKREAERLCKSFMGDNSPPRLPENFAFEVFHECAWGCRGQFYPSRYNSSRAKCIKCHFCGVFFSPNKFVFHSHRLGDSDKYVQPDAANFNSWRRHTRLLGDPPEEIVYAWEDIKAMFNGGTRKRMMAGSGSSSTPSPSPSAASSPPMSPCLHHTHHHAAQDAHSLHLLPPSHPLPLPLDLMAPPPPPLTMVGKAKEDHRRPKKACKRPSSPMAVSKMTPAAPSSRFQSVESLISKEEDLSRKPPSAKRATPSPLALPLPATSPWAGLHQAMTAAAAANSPLMWPHSPMIANYAGTRNSTLSCHISLS